MSPLNELEFEYGVLSRRLAGLQHRVDAQMRARTEQLQVLEGEVVRLRTQLVLARTCVLWGLNATALTRPLVQRRLKLERMTEQLAEASGVICRTGCAGHAAQTWQVAGRDSSKASRAAGIGPIYWRAPAHTPGPLARLAA